MLSMMAARPSGSIGLSIWGCVKLPDRTEVNSGSVRCRTRVVPLRTVNEGLSPRTLACLRCSHSSAAC